MKKPALLFLACLLLTGCAQRYVVTLNNGTQIDSMGKPRRDGASYIIKDGDGKETRIPAGRVSEIAPASMQEEEADKFRFIPAK
jgi:hypothetical protein